MWFASRRIGTWAGLGGLDAGRRLAPTLVNNEPKPQYQGRNRAVVEPIVAGARR